MNRVRVVKDTNYTVITNAILRDTRLTLKAKGLLVTVLGLPPTWDFTIKGISKVLKEGREAITSAIDELIECGYCSRTNERGEAGQFLGYDYTFYESPISESPASGLPDSGFPTQVNPTQLNKEFIKETKNKEKTQTLEIFQFWKDTMTLNGSTLLTSKRESKINARLKEGYNIERIKRAILGCAASPFHQGQNDNKTKYNDIELICRSGEKLEAFEAIPLPDQNGGLTDDQRKMREAVIKSQEMFYGRTFD